MQISHQMSDWLYGALLHLYPADFRAAYGQQMRLTFRDAYRAAYRRSGTGGLLALWLPTLLDLLKSALEEQTRKGEITMSKDRLRTMTAPLFIAIGALWLLAAFGEFVLLTGLGDPDTFWDVFWLLPVMIAFPLMLLALMGLRYRTHAAADPTGRIGLNLSVAGCAGLIAFFLIGMLLGIFAPGLDQGLWADIVITVGMFSILAGQALFGVDALRLKLLPRWNLLPVLPGLLILIQALHASVFAPLLWPLPPVLARLRAQLQLLLILFAPPPAHSDLARFGPTFLLYMTIGACWLLMGIAMMEHRQARHEAAVAA